MFVYMVYFLAVQGIVLSTCSQSTRGLYHPAPEIHQTPGGSDFCIVDGIAYRANERIPRESPCHVCLCHLGRAECSWMACPPVAPEGCYIFYGKGYCNPTLYICPIPEHLIGVRENYRKYENGWTTYENVSHTSGDCNILGVPYTTGDLIGIATTTCLECRCAKNHQLFCSPKCCFHPVKYEMSLIEQVTASRHPTTLQVIENPFRHLLAEYGF